MQYIIRNAVQPDVLVVDDNPPDGTGKLVEKLARNNPRINLISRHQKTGLGSAYIYKGLNTQ